MNPAAPLYYGPVAGSAAEAAIAAYQRGEVLIDRYRGRAGQPSDIQQADYLAMKASGDFSLPTPGLTRSGL